MESKSIILQPKESLKICSFKTAVWYSQTRSQKHRVYYYTDIFTTVGDNYNATVSEERPDLLAGIGSIEQRS
jgi:hypothetical protein